MRQHGFGLGVGDAVGQAGKRIETVDGDLVAGSDLRAQAQMPQAVERTVPEGDDVRTHARRAFWLQSNQAQARSFFALAS